MLRGCQIKIQTHKAPAQLLAAIELFKPDLFCAFPKTYVDLCRSNLENANLSSIQYWLSTGYANHESHIRRLMIFGRYFRDGDWHRDSCFIDNLGSPEFGFDGPLAFPFPVAAKTGTTRNSRDNWTIGYTEDLVVGVWVGNADNTPMQGTSGVTGAGPIFHDVMLAGTSLFPPHPFLKPAHNPPHYPPHNPPHYPR